MITNLLTRLEKVKPHGDKKWMACCPAHEDKSPSLAIKENRDGTILIHCFAGCGAAEVLRAVDLTMADLFSEKTIDDIKDWQAFLKRNERNKQTNQNELNEQLNKETILHLAKTKRERGERLTRKELDAEAKAYRELKNANHQ